MTPEETFEKIQSELAKSHFTKGKKSGLEMAAEILEKEADVLGKKDAACDDAAEGLAFACEEETILRMVILIRTEIANS